MAYTHTCRGKSYGAAHMSGFVAGHSNSGHNLHCTSWLAASIDQIEVIKWPQIAIHIIVGNPAVLN